MKRITAVLLSLVLVLLLGASALASTGDITVWYGASNDGYMEQSLQRVMLLGNKIYCFMNGMSSDSLLLVYDRDNGTTSSYELKSLNDQNYGETEEEPEEPEEEAEETGEDEEPVLRVDVEYSGWTEASLWFAHEGEIYAALVTYAYNYDDNTSKLEGGEIRKLVISGDSAELTECDMPRLDWSSMTEGGESGYEYSRYARSCDSANGKLYILTNDDSGNDMLLIYDLSDGFCEERYLQNINTFGVCQDGNLLISQYDWNTAQGVMKIGFYDPESESMEYKAEFDLSSGSPGNIYYKAENNTFL